VGPLRLEGKGKAALELEQLAVVVQRRARDQRVDDVDVLAHALERLAKRHAVQVLDHVGAAGAHAEDHASPAQAVERRERLGQHGRRARVEVDDRGADLHALCEGRGQRQLGRRVRPPALTRPDRIDAAILGCLQLLLQPLDVERRGDARSEPVHRAP